MLSSMAYGLKKFRKSKLKGDTKLYSQTAFEQELTHSRTQIIEPLTDLENDLSVKEGDIPVYDDNSILKRSSRKKTQLGSLLHSKEMLNDELANSVTQLIDPLEVLEDEFENHENEPLFYNELYFHNMVNYETNRAYRLENSFLLISIDISKLTTVNDDLSTSEKGVRTKEVNKLIKSLYKSTREIDIKGWFCENRVIGVICVNAEREKHESILNKLQEKLTGVMRKKYVDFIKIAGKSFPDSKCKENKTKVVPIKEVVTELYNEAAEIVSKKKQYFTLKRILDITGSLFAILLFSPLFVIIPILIKLTSKGPVLFKQERIGMDGKPFQFWKFRSMTHNNDNSIHHDFVTKLIKGEIKPEDENEGKLVFKMEHDPRITKIGKYLRKTSFDELPQFFNVLRGDMSLVGPRPPIEYEVEQYDTWHTRRVINLKPGITGFWQVEGRSATSFEDMVRMDLRYIKNCSLWLDIKLLLKTPIKAFIGKGAC